MNSLNKTTIDKIKKANILTPDELAELESLAVPTEPTDVAPGKDAAPVVKEPVKEPAMAPTPAPAVEPKLETAEPIKEETAMETPEAPAEIDAAPTPAIEDTTTAPEMPPMPAANAGVEPAGQVTVDDLAEIKKTTESLQAQIKSLEEIISKLGEEEVTEEFGITGKGKGLNGSDEYSDAADSLVKKMGGFSR